MQTIKCVVVGDGAVGKVRLRHNAMGADAADMSAYLLHNEQVSVGICAYGTWSSLRGVQS